MTSEISSSAKGVTAISGDSIAATDPFTGNPNDSPATPKPVTPRTDKAFFDGFPFEARFMCGIKRLHHQH